MKYYIMKFDKLENLVDFLKTCNPPDGMDKEEMLNTIRDILLDGRADYDYFAGI